MTKGTGPGRRNAALAGLACMILLGACQTDGPISDAKPKTFSYPGAEANGDGTSLAEAKPRRRAAARDGIVDEGDDERKAIVKQALNAAYKDSLEAVHPQLADATHALVVLRGMGKTCSTVTGSGRNSFGEFVEKTGKVFHPFMARAFDMEQRRFKATDRNTGPVVMAFAMSKDAALTADARMRGIGRDVEEQAGKPDAKALNDAQLLTLGCVAINAEGERGHVVKRISASLLEYFLFAKYKHPDIYGHFDNNDEILSLLRKLSRI